jgi:hypothetical protein
VISLSGVGGVFRSTNDGKSWQWLESMRGLHSRALLTAGSDVFVGTDSQGVFISRDNGMTWTKSKAISLSAFLSVNDIAVHGNTIFIAASANTPAGDVGGVFSSVDRGNSWSVEESEISKGGQIESIANTPVYGLALNKNFLWAATSSGLWARRLKR